MIPPEDVIEATRQRYQETKLKQDYNLMLIAQGKRSEADDPEHRDKRRARLMRDPSVRQTIESATETPALTQDTYERVIGGANFLGVAFLPIGVRAARTVGCIHVYQDGSAGTGFMVSPTLILTNHHVLPTPESAQGSWADFNYEDDERLQPLQKYTFDLDPNIFYFTDKDLDYTLVAVKPESHPVGDARLPLARFGYNRLSGAEGKAQEAERVIIVQHPSGASKKLALDDNNITKRLDNFLQYVTDTMPGSSGSPVFNNQWEVIGLHHSGVPDEFEDGPNKGKRRAIDGGVWQDFMGEDKLKWIANEGVRISRIMQNLAGRLGELTAERQAIANALLQAVPGSDPAGPSPDAWMAIASPNPPADNPPADKESLTKSDAIKPQDEAKPEAIKPPEETKPPEAKPLKDEVKPPKDEVGQGDLSVAVGGATGETAMAIKMAINGQSVTVTIPLEITVRLGAIAVGGGESAAPRDEIFEEKVVIDRNYANRDGYDPAFLGDGTSVPLPTLSPALAADAAIAGTPAAGLPPYVLPYDHYCVVMNKRRRVAFFAASNVSGEPSLRPNIGSREGDAWYADERIGADEQSNNGNYGHYGASGKSIDRGHLNRRLDTAWGTTADAALRGSNDTFHCTNCSPQHEGFNRSKEKWQGLENYLLDNVAQNRRLIIFTGPFFGDDDPTLKGLKVPLEFWKIVVCRRRADGKLTAGGFHVSQEDLIRPLGSEEAFKPTEHQAKIAWIREKTGLDFGYLIPLDLFAQTGAGGLEADRPLRPLESLSDILM